MDKLQKDLIKRSFGDINPSALADRFYGNLFSIQPAMKLIFPIDAETRNSELLAMLESGVALLDETGTDPRELEDSGRQIALYGVKEEHYAMVKVALIRSLRELNGGDLPARAESGWTELFGMMSEILKRGARRISDAHE